MSEAEVEKVNEKIIREAVEKYRELYQYANDILLKEHERFNRADEKAAKYSTMFVFLIGVVIYFDKWILGLLNWPEFPIRLPPDIPLFLAGIAGLLALLSSAGGLFLSTHVIKQRPIVSRPLNQEVLDFFENQPRINIYYGLAREISKAYEKNVAATNKKYVALKWSHYLMVLTVLLLVELLLMYCLYSWS